MKFFLDFSKLSRKILEELKSLVSSGRDEKQAEIAANEPKRDDYFDTKKYEKDHALWEINKQTCDDLFNQIRKAIEEELERRPEETESRSKEPERRPAEDHKSASIFENLGAFEDKPVEDIFIDDIFRYADSQKDATLWSVLKDVGAQSASDRIAELPETQRGAAEKRDKELRELIDRGQRMKDAGYTDEYVDQILRLTYDMSKDGLREAAGKIDLSEITTLFPKSSVDAFDLFDKRKIISEAGWLNSSNGVKEKLGDGAYRSFTEYVASKMSADAFNKIEEANEQQGHNSYYEQSCYRKYAVLKSMGYDFKKYETWEDAEKNLTDSGFFVHDKDGNMREVFDKLKDSPNKLNLYCEGQTVFDAAIQLFLENATIPGNERDSYSMTLIRTESKGHVPEIKDENIYGKINDKGRKYYTGVCESFGHITATRANDKEKVLTAARVPHSRIHALWFMEYGHVDSNGTYVKQTSKNMGGDFQFWAHQANEIDACTHNLPTVYVGNLKEIPDSYGAAKKALSSYENKVAAK